MELDGQQINERKSPDIFGVKIWTFFYIFIYIAFHLKKVNIVKNSRDLQSLLTGEFINVHVIHAQNWGTLMTVW